MSISIQDDTKVCTVARAELSIQCSNNCGVPTPPEETCSEICFDRVFDCHAFSKHCSVAIRWFVLLSGLVTRTNQ